MCARDMVTFVETVKAAIVPIKLGGVACHGQCRQVKHCHKKASFHHLHVRLHRSTPNTSKKFLTFILICGGKLVTER